MGLSALFISSMAAFFSVTGIGMLFSGSFLAVCLMAASLEVGKLVTASFLYRYWKTVNWLQKTYMTIAVVVLIGITSMGIFGFLSNSYMGATQEFDTKLTKLEVYKEQLVMLEEDKVFLKNELEESVNALPSNYITAKRKLREEYNPKIQTISLQIVDLKTEIGQIEIDMVDTGVDIGPLLYIAEAFNTDIDTAVKWIMLILILVFDPLAVIMVIGFNIALLDGQRRTDDSARRYKVFEKRRPTPEVYTALDPQGKTKSGFVKGNLYDKQPKKKTKPKKKPKIKEEPKKVSTNPLEEWQKKTEKKVEQGMDMGNETPKRNPSSDGGPADDRGGETYIAPSKKK